MIEQLTKEKLEKKVRICNIGLGTSMVGIVAGIILTLGGIFFNSQLRRIPIPTTYTNYKNAQTTLDMLRNKRLERRLEFPYKIQETNEVQNMIYTPQQRKLDELTVNAIIEVQNDISEMENKPEIKQYCAEIARINHNVLKSFYTGMVTYALGLAGFTASLFKKCKYKSKIRNLE